MSKEIGSKIRQIRELKGFSQDFIANQLGISQRAYSKMEMNQSKLDWGRITKIADILEVDPMDIVAFDDNLIFNNCTQSGKFQQFTNMIPDKLIEQYEERIKWLEGEVTFLRKELKNSEQK